MLSVSQSDAAPMSLQVLQTNILFVLQNLQGGSSACAGRVSEALAFLQLTFP